MEGEGVVVFRAWALAHERKCTIADLRVGDATEGERGNAKYEDEDVGDVLALRAIAGQLQVLGYQNYAVPGGVQAPLGIWSRV